MDTSLLTENLKGHLRNHRSVYHRRQIPGEANHGGRPSHLTRPPPLLPRLPHQPHPGAFPYSMATSGTNPHQEIGPPAPSI
ncbi:hypothetical protein Pcinc_040784 [Petrolisthes cinctipes]|uniref:Uncharacterized protein n=1 Tax=Petrolisthes cinctipes TaxID=88211 RepID=A0AAE1BL70_PETCI|nr:hypothetical protein Pcinc_040784 [Petrolisthes cinctipes]